VNRKTQGFLYILGQIEKVGGHKQIFGELFWNVLQRVQMHLIFSCNVRILCLSCNIKKHKITAKLSKTYIAETNDVLIVSPRLYCYRFLSSLNMNQVSEISE